MSTAKTQCPANGTEPCTKKLKVESVPVFHSPINDVIAPPNKPSKCTWNRINDKTQINPHSTHEWRRTSKILPDILKTIGNTPLVKLNKIPQHEGIKANVYVKCEYFNPGGSVKDRIGYRMVKDAEEQGLLKPGCTIIEPSSGNTGIGLALAAAVKGYRCIIVMSEKMSNEKVSTLKALGAEIVRTPVNQDSNSPTGMFGTTHKLHEQIPNSVILDQYSNPGNPLAHYDTTAEEIYDQCDKNVDMLVMGAGTGGTVTGIGRKFKEISPKTILVGADPYGSVLAVPDSLNKTDIDFYEVEGIGYDFIPTVLDRAVVDRWVKTSDKESLLMARRLIQEEGLLCGSSSGAAVVAGLKAAKALKEGQNVVILLPDSIRNYITKFISDQWMEAREFVPSENTEHHWWWDKKVTDLELATLQTASAATTCDRALQLMKKLAVDQIPVVESNGEIVGMITLQLLLTRIVDKKIQPSDPIDSIVMRIYPKLYNTANLGLVSRVLEKEPYVLILKKDDASNIIKPVAIVTPIDILQYVSSNK
ncbi:cystathionine beta-synthase-like [Sitophilus oryzae]|uniref:Cystathionine beta-synthase n=1 Tax=Sitophilus oryzae TaxID=7048 RepID=A0A6J2XRC5_SITOR|nr:cystathionine beta-synthase-like [Sitophilus oryzae]